MNRTFGTPWRECGGVSSEAVHDVRMSRINIDIDDELIAEVMRRFQLKTKSEAVDLALRRLLDEARAGDDPEAP